MKKTSFVLIAVCLAAFLAITLISARVFEYVPHSEDEVAYIFQAKVFAQNRLAVPTPANRQAFWTPFVVDYQGQRFGKYPPGWPFLLSLGVRLNAPWLVNAGLGTLTLALIARLGNCFYSRDLPSLRKNSDPTRLQTGLWAAALALTTPGFLLLSASLLSHTASLFWSTLALLGLFLTSSRKRHSVHVSRFTPHAFYAFLTGLTLGAAFITRPFAGVGIGLAVGVFLLAMMIRREVGGTSLLWLSLGGLLMAILSPLYWWAITGEATFNAYLLVWPYDRIGFGPDIGPEGYTLSNALIFNTWVKLLTLAAGLFGWPGWSNLLFLPIPFLARRANRWDWLLLGAILSLVFVHTFYWAFGGAEGGFPRYYYDALPAFVLLTIRGIQIFGDILVNWQKRNPLLRNIPGATDQRKNLLRWLPAGLAVILVGCNLVWNLPPLLAAQKGKYGITAVPLQAVERANLPPPALVIVKNTKEWNDFAAPFAANSPTLDGPIVYASDEGVEVTQALQQQFKDRTCWELEEETLDPCQQ